MASLKALPWITMILLSTLPGWTLDDLNANVAFLQVLWLPPTAKSICVD